MDDSEEAGNTLHALWEEVRSLDTNTPQGQALEITDNVRGLFQRAASTLAVASAQVESALSSAEHATALLRLMRERITGGSHRIGRALLRMYDLRDVGDLDGARQQMRDVLAVEVVPLYRNIAQGELEKLDDLARERAGSQD